MILEVKLCAGVPSEIIASQGKAFIGLPVLVYDEDNGQPIRKEIGTIKDFEIRPEGAVMIKCEIKDEEWKDKYASQLNPFPWEAIGPSKPALIIPS